MVNTNFPYPSSVPLALVTDLDAVAHNYRTLCSYVKKGTLCATVLKANAYGMGVKEVAARLYHEGCRHFFMAHLSEAIELKSFVGDDSLIYVLTDLRQGDEELYTLYNLIPILSSLSQIQIWNAFSQRKQKCLKAALHFDTGMTRTGLTPRVVKNLELLTLSHIEIVCVMSHLACPYQPTNPMNEAQRLSFDELRARFPFALGSLANSGGVCLGQPYHYDLIRPGIALTGCPSSIPVGDYKLRPVLKAYAQVLQINEIQRGESVGYDTTFIAARPSRIATLGVGYADGYSRSLSNRGEVYFGGQRLPVVGRVSMDLITIDITDVPMDKIHCRDWVELFGDNLLAHEVAEKAGTISNELFTRLGSRFERFYVGATQQTRGVA
ncbi:MAG: alanine racemase [Proteobacteria bacterium]|nr:alanine racemase [Pseudomonadota bacterium]